MILDFDQHKKDQFYAVALKLQEHPELYLNFDSVADFYQAEFLNEFPKGTVWTATGLDDGAEQFYAKIEFKSFKIIISKIDDTYTEITVSKT